MRIMLVTMNQPDTENMKSKMFWKKYADVELSDLEVKQSESNIIGFFQILHEWGRKDKDKVISNKGGVDENGMSNII